MNIYDLWGHIKDRKGDELLLYEYTWTFLRVSKVDFSIQTARL